MPDSTIPPKIYTKNDIPRVEDMADYIFRIESVLGLLAALPGTPKLPKDMNCLTYQKANDIELALLETERAIHALEKSWFYSGEIDSGGF